MLYANNKIILRLPLKLILSDNFNRSLNKDTRKILYFLIHIIQKKYSKDIKNNLFTVNVSEILQYFLLDESKQKKIEILLNQLSNQIMENQESVLENIKLENENFYFSFNSEILEKIINNNHFAILDLSLMYELTSDYTCLLYQIMCLYVKRQHPIWYISLKEIKEYLNLNNDSYKRYDNFKKHILKKSFKEINDKCSFFISTKEIKAGQGGKVVALKITANSKKMYDLIKLEKRI